MAIVTGDRYLDLLARFLEENAGALLDGSLVLKLNPVGLHYVQTRLEALQELERLRTGAPVDYLRAYISDLGDHRALEQLSRVLRLLSAVKVVSVLPLPARDPTPITLLPFGRLKSLELRGCDLSKSAARGLLELRPFLEKLICHNSVDALRHIFAERTVEIQDAQVWSRLASVSCAFNGMLLMDDSLQLLPAVQFLDLSRNRLAKVANLLRCSKLRYLDLGFNHLRTISSFSQVKAKINKVVLRNNALSSLQALPSLELLWLEGNPIAFTSSYREEVLSVFPDPSKVLFDGRKISRLESWNVSIIISKRRMERAGFGSYALAENIAASTGIPLRGGDDRTQTTMHLFNFSSRAKRKVSRLACIQDAQKSVQTEGEQDDSPRFHGSSSYHGDAEERNQDTVDACDQDRTDALELMRKVEALRKEGSNTWLQELKGLLEETNGHQAQSISSLAFEKKNSLTGQQKRRVQKRLDRNSQQKLFEESSNVEPKGEALKVHTGEDDESLMNLKEDVAFDESSEISQTVNEAEESSSVDDGFGSFRVIDEMVESLAQPGHPASPPHYHEDVLHKRQNLEKEILRLSFDSSCGPSLSDSDTSTDSRPGSSSSEGSPKTLAYKEVLQTTDFEIHTESFRVHKGTREHLRNAERTYVPFHGSSNTATEESDCNREPKSLNGQHISVTRSWPNMPKEKATEALRTNHSDPACMADILANAGGGDKLETNPKKSAINNKIKGKGKQVQSLTVLGQESLEDSLQHEDGLKISKPDSFDIEEKNIGLTTQQSTCGSENKFLSADSLPCMNLGSYVPVIGKDSGVLTEETGNNGHMLRDGDQVQFGNGSLEDPVEKFFRLKIGDFKELECCLHYLKCSCIRMWEDTPIEREIFLLISSSDTLYMLVDSKRNSRLQSQAGIVLLVLASHKLQDVKKVKVGLGLQALRVDIGHSASYLFVTRDVNASRDILDMLERAIKKNNGPPFLLESWEQVQLKMFEKFVSGAARTNIRMYMMLFFCHGHTLENIWAARSLFLTSRHIFVCLENLMHFGKTAEDSIALQNPYLIIEYWASICDLSEVVAGPRHGGYVTLSFRKVSMGPYSSFDLLNTRVEDRSEDSGSSCIWKLRGLSEEAVSKFASLLHATHMEVALYPFSVKSLA